MNVFLWLQMYKTYSNQFKCFGLYECFRPALMICDPDLLKQMFIIDSEHFLDRRFLPKIPGSIINDSLPSLRNEDWKDMHAIVTPLFTPSKMKRMFPLVLEQVRALVSFCCQNIDMDGHFAINDILRKATLSTGLSCGCGIEGNIFSNEDGDSNMRVVSSTVDDSLSVTKAIMLLWSARISKLLGVKFDDSIFQELVGVLKKSMKNRYEGQEREDFLTFLLHANMKINNTAIPGKAGEYSMGV